MSKSVCLTTCLFCVALSLASQEPAVYSASPPASEPAPCLIVKHKGTVGRRLIWTAVIGVPIAPGTKYDLVDSLNLKGAKTAYKEKELDKLQAEGVRVIILEKKYQAEALENARQECRRTNSVP